MVFYLYKVTNQITGKAYIGQASGYSVKNRFARHLSTARTGRGYALHEAIRRDGEENFFCNHIMDAFTKDDLEKLEKDLIIQENTLAPHGYNLTTGGAAGEKAGEPIKFEGKIYISLAALARDYMQNSHNVRQRIVRYGWTLRQALLLDTPPPKNARGIETVVNDPKGKQIFKSFRDACQHYKHDEAKIRGRIDKGQTIEEALELIPRDAKNRTAHNAQPLMIEEEYFSSIKAACDHYALRSDKYFDRKSKGWSLEQIFGIHEPPKRNHPLDKSFEVSGMIFPTLEGATRYFGLYQHAISTRLRAGWTNEEAAGLVSRKRKYGTNPNSISYEVGGRTFDSIKEMADTYKVNYKLLRKRLRQLKWPVNQALGLEQRKSARKDVR